jgi:lantibiotic biosynthesis protein
LITQTTAVRRAAQLALTLTAPDAPPAEASSARQSLANGTAGIALLHIERAHAGVGTWQQAHRWITAAASDQLNAGDASGLYLGAPAVTFLLHTAADRTVRYQGALATLDRHVAALTHRRAAAATERIRRAALPTFHEYDIFSGLSGIGALLMHREPGGTALEAVLDYLVALTHPLRHEGVTVPGWWVGHDPHTRTSARYRHGHSNQGAAHGIAGPLMLLAQTARRGLTVAGQHTAIETICSWYDRWRQPGPAGAWWPEHITLNNLRTGQTRQTGPARPSWCYGTPGITRALQLAAIATGDTTRQHAAERDLADCLTDPHQLKHLTDPGICHGWAGLHQSAWRAANDAATSALTACIPQLTAALTTAAETAPQHGPHFLNGAAGTALALSTAASATAPTSGWDACLLID